MSEQRNPFPGPQPYGAEDEERFFGRRTARFALANQIVVERSVTLYGPSGCGKSSVFAAGVLPLLQRERDVRAVVVKGWPESASPLEGLLQEMSDALRVARTPREDGAPLGGARARVERVVKWAMQRSSRPIVIYLDQVEQLLFPWRMDPAATEELFEAAEAIADLPILGISLVLALREDFLGLFRARMRHRPRLLDAGFRLGRLTIGEMADAACEAAAKGDPPQTWSRPEILALLMQFPAPGQPPREDAEVEAVFAQIVCRAQWDLRADAGAVERPAAFAEATLRDYVDRTLRALGPTESAARAFLESDLIDANGGRRLLTKSQAHEALRKHGLPAEGCDALIQHVERASILRHHEHQTEVYFELGHDLLARHLREQRALREVEAEQRLRMEAAAAKLDAAVREAEANAKRLRQALMVKIMVSLLAVLAGAAITFWWRSARQRDQSREQARLRGVLIQQILAEDRATAFGALLALDPETDGYLPLAHFALQSPPAKVTLRGAGDKALGAAWSPDGAHVLSCYTDGTVRVFRADGEGDPLILGDGERHAVTHAEYDARGERVVAAAGATAYVWDATTGEMLQGLPHARTITTARFSPDGRSVATASNDAMVAVWTVGSAAPPALFAGHLGPVRDLAWSPDGRSLASVSDDGTLLVWDPTDAAPPRLFCCHPVGINRLAMGLNAEAGIMHVQWSADGRKILTASSYSAPLIGKALLRVWSVDDSAPPIDLGLDQLTYTARLSPEGDRVAAALADGTVRIWTLAHPEASPVELRGHQAEVRDVDWSPDGQYVATASNDRAVRVFRANGDGTPLVLRGHRSRVTSVRFSADGRRVVSASDDGTSKVWPTVEWNTVARIGGPAFGRRHSADVSPDGLRAAVAADGAGLVHVVTLGVAAPPLHVETPTVVSTVRWSRHGNRLATTAQRAEPNGGFTASIWSLDRAVPAPATADRAAGSRVRAGDPGARVVLAGHTEPVYAVDFAPDDARVATASLDGTARIWDVATGALLTTFEHTAARIGNKTGCRLYGVAWSPDGSRLVTTCEERVAVVWDVAAPDKPLAVLEGHTDAVEFAAWSPDGAHIVTSSFDRTARLWDADGAGTPVVLDHDSLVLSAVYSPDQTKLLTVSMDDRTAYVWDLGADPSAPRVPLRLRHDDPIASASFAPDGKAAFVVSDRSVRVWELDPPTVRARLEAMNADCLSAEARRTFLKEWKSQAESAYAACERSHGRTPPSTYPGRFVAP